MLIHFSVEFQPRATNDYEILLQSFHSGSDDSIASQMYSYIDCDAAIGRIKSKTYLKKESKYICNKSILFHYLLGMTINFIVRRLYNLHQCHLVKKQSLHYMVNFRKLIFNAV